MEILELLSNKILSKNRTMFKYKIDEETKEAIFTLALPQDNKETVKIKIKSFRGVSKLVVESEHNGTYSLELDDSYINLMPNSTKIQDGLLTIKFSLKRETVIDVELTD